MPEIKLPTADRRMVSYRTRPRTHHWKMANGASRSRTFFSAAHVVADPLAEADPWLSAALDWDATIDYRRYLWSLGLGVAEAMDTAQRGMGLNWPTALELIRRSVEAARDKFPRSRDSMWLSFRSSAMWKSLSRLNDLAAVSVGDAL
jgi:hypothetical protein